MFFISGKGVVPAPLTIQTFMLEQLWPGFMVVGYKGFKILKICNFYLKKVSCYLSFGFIAVYYILFLNPFRACLDTSEVGELESCHLLGEYTMTRDFVCLSSSDKLNYSINVHDEGNTLEVVGVCCKLY